MNKTEVFTKILEVVFSSGPVSKRPTSGPIYKGLTVTTSTVSESGHYLNLENFIWVTIGGFGVLVLMAICMKIGNPIRRVRRQLLNARLAPNVITRRQDPDDRNLDTGSLLRVTEHGPACDWPPPPPPPYCECAEEPPPRYSACFLKDTNTKDTESKVHGQRQNVLYKDESIAINASEHVGRMRTELVFVNGRIVERPKLDLNSYNNETEAASNDNVKESGHADLKGRVVYKDKTDHVTINIY